MDSSQGSFQLSLRDKAKIYLAVADDVDQDFFQRPAIQVIVADQQIKLLIFNPQIEEVVQWSG